MWHYDVQVARKKTVFDNPAEYTRAQLPDFRPVCKKKADNEYREVPT